ncbi:MAG TPA: DUF695 domain-containing protein [Candidatus Acidoferrales bacterium]|nr:DUF695 domain-containing protein [Candidatus Acidoferrales bacterium]
MSEWLSYTRDEGGAPAVVDFNAELDDRDVRAQCATCISLVLSGYQCDAGGMPTDSVDDELYALERRLEDALDARGGVLAATLAQKGTYEFLAYAPADLSQACADLARAAGFAVASYAAADDPQWTRYARLALSGDELEDARDREQLEELETAGEDLERAREIFFDFDFPDGERAEAARTAFGGGTIEAAGATDDEGTEVQTVFVAVPTLEAVRAERTRLSAIALRFGGVYRGWGTDPDR